MSKRKENWVNGKWCWAQYSKKRVGLGICGQQAFLFLQARAEEEGFDEELFSTAHLIAAAPDLYEALDKIVRSVLMLHLPVHAGLLNEALSALARARGEEPSDAA